jgi:predicted nucleic acid-binding protein
MILVDTSVWIESFRRRPRLRVDELVDFDEIVTCLPVVQEVLQGFRDEAAYRVARESLLALPIVESPMTMDAVEEAVRIFRVARRTGKTVRSSIDCLVAACALRNDLEVLHADRDYAAIAQVTGLRQRRV